MDKTELHKKFEQIYSQKLEPKIIPLEQERKGSSNVLNTWGWIACLLFLISIGGFLLFKKANILILVIPAFIIFLIVGKKQNDFRRKIKHQLLMEIFSLFGQFNYSDKELITEKEIRKTGLFRYFRHKTDDDRITGNYKGMDVMLVETKLTHAEKRSNNYQKNINENEAIDFKGLIVKTVLNKPYKGKTLLHQKAIGQTGQKQAIKSFLSEDFGDEKADKIANSKVVDVVTGVLSFAEKIPVKNVKLSSDGLSFDFGREKETNIDRKLKEVTLEDPEFNQMYDVYSDDQVEARYIITPTFMERLKNIREVIGGFDVHCMIEDKYITLFISTPVNFFEVGDVSVPLDNKQIYEKVFIQLISIFNLIHYFKLDKKLGL